MDTITRTRLIGGRYEIHDELLRCRFSTLYSCVDIQTWTPLVLRRLHLPVVLKPERQAQAREQFAREAEALATLHHANLPRVVDHVEDQGEFFILMEPFEGYTLDYVVEELGAPPAEALLRRWMDQVADALDYLHARQIVYRDLRPQTVLITPYAVVKLVDFGLARMVSDMERGQTLFRGMGALSYAAPEQLGNQRSEPSMDLYALGATFFFLATRQEPPSAMERVETGDPLPSICQLNPAVTPELEALVHSLMALDPRQRPQSAKQVRDWLQHLAEAQPVGFMTKRLEAGPVAEPAEPPPEEAPPVAVPRLEEPPTPAEPATAVAPPAERPAAVAPPMAASAVREDDTPSGIQRLFNLKLPWFNRAQQKDDAPRPSGPSEDDLAQFPFVDLSTFELERDVASLIDEATARKVGGICIGRPVGNEITLAVKDPTHVYIYDLISFATGGRYKPVLMRADPLTIDLAQEYTYRLGERLQHVSWLEWLEKKKYQTVEVAFIQGEEQAMLLQAEDVRGPAVEAVDRLIKEAISIRASDIHIETYETEVVCRYRIDGILHVMDTWPRRDAQAIVKRIKIMANMDIAQDRVTQGGRISVRVADKEFDLRVSCVPVPDGESIVMRLLSKGTFNLKLEDLGFSPHNLGIYRKLVEQPHGMLLVSGPTGSGKSTTLYATLAEINRPDRKILTVEDPIEYKMQGVVQVQVNMAPREEDKKLTFARALREFLRQDPDVILVGEIRDDETAAISVQAALTGHLLLSTIHTNDALTIITRLLDRGIEPFLVSSTLLGGIAQRLVRTTCDGCKEEVPVPSTLIDMFTAEGMEPRMFRGMGCLKCHKTGYRGRMAIHEVLEVDSEMRDMIAAGANAGELGRHAEARGMKTLLQDGLRKVVDGRVTMEEVRRVCMSV